MIFDYWVETYRSDLNNLYDIYLDSAKASTLKFIQYIPFYTFCKIIYGQSSKNINKYDRLYI